jgi:hypothetical protein
MNPNRESFTPDEIRAVAELVSNPGFQILQTALDAQFETIGLELRQALNDDREKRLLATWRAFGAIKHLLRHAPETFARDFQAKIDEGDVDPDVLAAFNQAVPSGAPVPIGRPPQFNPSNFGKPPAPPFHPSQLKFPFPPLDGSGATR